MDCLVVLGGPMSAWDHSKHPWLTTEKRLIEGMLRAGKPVLGICLGAQLLADVLGARTYRGPQTESGWCKLRAADESRTVLSRGHAVYQSNNALLDRLLDRWLAELHFAVS